MGIPCVNGLSKLKKCEMNHIETIDKLLALMSKNHIPRERLSINYFKGYHETNPSISLNMLR